MNSRITITLNRTETRYAFLYVLILFAGVATLTIWIIFRNSGAFSTNESLSNNAYFLQDKEFTAKQKEAIPLYDTLYKRITLMQKMPTNPSTETDIRYGINTLNSFYQDLAANDPRDISFQQMALFLKLYFEDVAVYKKKIENIQRFQDQLNQCEVGYKDQQTQYNQLKAALAAKSN